MSAWAGVGFGVSVPRLPQSRYAVCAASGKIATAKAQAGKSVSRQRHTLEKKEEEKEKGLKGAKGVGFLISSLLPFRGGCLRASAIRTFERVFSVPPFKCRLSQIPLRSISDKRRLTGWGFPA